MKTILGFTLALSLVASVTQAETDAKAVVSHYADLAHAMYSDSLATAKDLQKAVDQLIAQPTETNLKTAKEAWIKARVPYQQTEAYRFGNAIVDDWEGKVNAWPLDEGLIDYVAASYGGESDDNPYRSANVIANPKLTLSGKTIDARKITPALLADTLHEVDGVEANVATGYHAIEFLLWGQDLHGTKAGAGERPASDFDPKNCSWGNCDRRGAYLKAATDLLVDDLTWMTAQWAKQGSARLNLEQGDVNASLSSIFTGMGSLSYGELAGQRMKLGVLLHDPEEEQDCFSDNTAWSHFYDALGIQNVYTGTYTRIDGSKMTGPNLSGLVAAKDASIDQTLRAKLDATLNKMQVLVDSTQKGVAYDQLLAEGNDAGNAMVLAGVEALTEQTKAIEKAIAIMDLSPITFEGSDSLDSPQKVFQ